MSAYGNNTNSSLTEIERGQLTHASNKKVVYQIVNGWDLKSAAECDACWKQGWVTLIQEIQRIEPDQTKQAALLNTISSEDFHWNWFKKAIHYKTNEYEWFHLYADGKPQAVCIIYHPKRSALDTGDIFYVEYLAVAPWNRKCSFRVRDFGRLGETILRAAQIFAVSKLNLRPGFGLHSLPKAVGFYRNIHMVTVLGEEKDQMPYFELPQAHATTLMKAS